MAKTTKSKEAIKEKTPEMNNNTNEVWNFFDVTIALF